MSTPPLTNAPVNAAETTTADERPPSAKLTVVSPGVGSGDSSLAPATSSSNAKKVILEFKGYSEDSIEEMTPERAIRNGWLTIEKGIENNIFTLDDAQINGWVPVTVQGKLWGTYTKMLKTAVEEGYMTVEQAIDAGHITKKQAAKADWIQKK